jgi:hypothetical protein
LCPVLLCPVLAWSGSNSNPADYTINVHVSASYVTETMKVELSVVIKAKKYQLRGNAINEVLALGDYKAKLLRDEHRTAYDSYQTYEFLFPDGKTRQYQVVGASE